MRRDYTDWTPPYKGASKLSPEPSVVAAGDRHGVPDSELPHPHLLPHSNGVAAVEPSLPSISEKGEHGSAQTNGHVP